MCEKLETEARDERDAAISEAWRLCERLESATRPMEPLSYQSNDPWPRIDACVTRMLEIPADETPTPADETPPDLILSAGAPNPEAKPLHVGVGARGPASAGELGGARGEERDAGEGTTRSAAAARLFGRGAVRNSADNGHGQQSASILDPIRSVPPIATYVNDPSAAKLSCWGQESDRRAAEAWGSFRTPAPTASRPPVYEGVTSPEEAEFQFEEARFTLLLSSSSVNPEG